MDALKEKIWQQLENMSEVDLQAVLDLLEFLEWRKQKRQQTLLSTTSKDLENESDAAWLESDISNLGSYEPYDWQPGELNEGVPVKYIPGVGVVIVNE